ncbi:RagB/SusD family nutrient uptake outer membrane protein [Mariniphaga sediminis]|uniref:RagB/SusD family nutrient uptake outer membrane protein n=1 Tax=Mariniphaga sediminis TaxID=1628158 RepID=UPI003569C278
MKKQKLIFIISFLFMISCEGFLEQEPLSSVNSENFFKTEADVQASISAVYSQLKSHYASLVFYFGDISTEMANNGETNSTLDRGEYTAADGVFRSFWTNMYKTINYANVAIENIPGVTMDNAIKEKYLGEAHFLRALAYFELVKGFGGVPKITKPTKDETNNFLPRSTSDEIYELILSDLQYAESVLPDEKSKGRATIWAVKALMAKVYLQKGDFEKTREKSLEVINSSVHELAPFLKDVFDISKENGVEHIFSIQFLGDDTEGLGSSISRVYASRNPEINPSGLPSYAGIAAESDFYNSIPDHFRKRFTILAEFPSSYYPEIKATGPAQAGPCCMKFWDPLYGTRIGGDDANWMLIRYADVLLMYAEAENELNGPTPSAYEAVNKIRKRARDENQNNIDEPDELYELPDLEGLSKEQFREAVWKEREMELCFEGHHRWDLIRTNRFVEVLNSNGVPVSEVNKLFPIPHLELLANPNLIQNTGY